MSAPANTQIMPFEQRVQHVAQEVSKRLKQRQPSNKNALRARLWCQWLRKEVLA